MRTLCVNIHAPYLPPGIYRSAPIAPCVIPACVLQREFQSEMVGGSGNARLQSGCLPI